MQSSGTVAAVTTAITYATAKSTLNSNRRGQFIHARTNSSSSRRRSSRAIGRESDCSITNDNDNDMNAKKKKKKKKRTARTRVNNNNSKTTAFASSSSATTTRTKSDISSIFDEVKANTETTFWGKLSAAYKIFFPISEEDTARAEAKKRLRMILVADRCTMSDQSMEEMKKKIIAVVEQYVDVDEDVPVDIKVKDDVAYGTVYGITVPVSKVKAEYDAENDAYMMGAQFVYDDETWDELQKETEEDE
jgi:cell division topological specificity factor MinE